MTTNNTVSELRKNPKGFVDEKNGIGNIASGREYTPESWKTTSPLEMTRELLGQKGGRGWVDHTELLKNSEWGCPGSPRDIYVSNPYHLWLDGRQELNALEKFGWSVWIGGGSVYRYNTIEICISMTAEDAMKLSEQTAVLLVDAKTELKEARKRSRTAWQDTYEEVSRLEKTVKHLETKLRILKEVK